VKRDEGERARSRGLERTQVKGGNRGGARLLASKVARNSDGLQTGLQYEGAEKTHDLDAIRGLISEKEVGLASA